MTTSVITSVPAAARKVPAGSRTAPTRSARAAMSALAAAPAASRVKREVTTATSPPGRTRSSDLTMKWLWMLWRRGLWRPVVEDDRTEGHVADHQVETAVGQVGVGEGLGPDGGVG